MGHTSLRRSLFAALLLPAALAAATLGPAPVLAQDADGKVTAQEESGDLVDEFFRHLHERRRQEAEQRRKLAEYRQRLAAEQAEKTRKADNANKRRAVTPNALAQVEGTWVFEGMVNDLHLRIAVVFQRDGVYAAAARRFENGVIAQDVRDDGTFKLTGDSIVFFTDGERIEREYRYDAEKGLLWVAFPEWNHNIGFTPYKG